MKYMYYNRMISYKSINNMLWIFFSKTACNDCFNFKTEFETESGRIYKNDSGDVYEMSIYVGGRNRKWKKCD